MLNIISRIMRPSLLTGAARHAALPYDHERAGALLRPLRGWGAGYSNSLQTWKDVLAENIIDA